jgi:hypothetical protein
MSRDDAIRRAREFVLQTTGIDADPDRMDLRGSTWRAFYGAVHFYTAEIAAGAIIDGGEYNVDVDDVTGTVTVFA